MSGLFVTFEGIDRSGKTTQAALLCQALGDVALPVREPGGTAPGERIRALLKDPELELSAEAEALLFAAARSELVRQVIRPALEEGRVVVSDRFLDSSLAYQGAARGLGVEEVERINHFATGGLTPDLTLLLEIDPAQAASRGGEDDRFEREGAALQEQVAAAYDRLAATDSLRWRRIAADRDPEAVHADVLAAVEAAPEDASVTAAPEDTGVRPAPQEAGVTGAGEPGQARAPSIAGTEDHPHARMTLRTALATHPSHAYLFHGPAGVGKRTAARAFAAELLTQGSPDPESTRRRALSGSHPDMTWVRPSGAHVMRTQDVDEPVIAAASRTPFEASRRVFVLERVDTMNDEVANRLLKTLEEPASFVHLLLITDAFDQVLPTVVSRCQSVRFDRLPVSRIAAELEREGVEPARAAACARLALGSAARARYLASTEGEALRADADRIVTAALAGGAARPADAPPPWRGLLDRAEERRAAAESAVVEECRERLQSEPKGRERNALEKAFEEAARRDGRRARTEVLDLGLTLAALGFRDLLCLAEGAEEAALDRDRAEELAASAHSRDPGRLRAAAERCEDTRLSLELNVTEELALEALGFRLARLVGTA